MAKPTKEKSILGKVGEAIDHALHPGSTPSPDAATQPGPSVPPEDTDDSSYVSEMESHKKFDKFNKGE